MGEISRLQLETREVGQGRTALGAAGSIARARLRDTEQAGQNALVAASLATQAIATGRANLEQAGAVISEIATKFGTARKNAAAQTILTDATIEADRQLAELFNDPEADPLALANSANDALLALRNDAVNQATALGPEQRQFVLTKLDGLRAQRVASARQEGFRREADNQRANYQDIAEHLRLKMYDPTLSTAERQDAFNDLLAATDNFSFYIGEEAAEKIRNREAENFRGQAWVEAYLQNPQKALEILPQMGFNPEQQASFRRKALAELERVDREERRAEERADQAERERNEDLFNEAVSSFIDGGDSLSQLRAQAIKDPSIAPVFLKMQGYVQQQQRFRKALSGGGEATRVKTTPGTFKNLTDRILLGDFQNLDQVIETTNELFAEGQLSENDSLRIIQLYTAEGRRQRNENTAKFNDEVKVKASQLGELIAPTNRSTGKRNTSAVNLAKNLKSELVDKGRALLEEGQSPNTDRLVDEVVQENLPTIATTLEGKTLKQINGVFASVEEAEKAGVTGEELERIQFQDKLIKAADEQNAKTAKIRADAQREADQARLEQLKKEQIERVGEETFRRQEERRVRRETEQQERQVLEERLTTTDPRSTGFNELVDLELNKLHGDNIQNVDRNTLAIQRSRIRQNLARRRRQLLRTQERRTQREAAREDVERRRQIEQTNAELNAITNRLRQFNADQRQAQ